MAPRLSLAAWSRLCALAAHRLYHPVAPPADEVFSLLCGPAGTEVTDQQDGTRRITYPDGSSVLVTADGTVQTSDLPGSELSDVVPALLGDFGLSVSEVASLSATVTGRAGGLTTAQRMTKEARQERARKAAEARWGKPRAN